jgi:hypothetical protein
VRCGSRIWCRREKPIIAATSPIVNSACAVTAVPGCALRGLSRKVALCTHGYAMCSYEVS